MTTTARDLFALPAQSESDITDLLSVIPALSHLGYSSYRHLEDKNNYTTRDDRVKVETVFYYNSDGRRIWQLKRVTFDTRPVLIMQNAGRDGDDHSRVFLVDRQAMNDLASYMISIARPEEDEDEGDFLTISLDEMRDDLDTFYGSSLEDMRQATVRQGHQRQVAQNILAVRPDLEGHWVLAQAPDKVLHVERNMWTVESHVREHGKPEDGMVIRIPGMLAPEPA